MAAAATTEQNQGPPPPDSDPAGESGGGLTGVTEALYRLRSNWSPASHAGKSAIVALPRPDVIAAYHRDDAAPEALATADTVPAPVPPPHVDTIA